MVKGGIATNVAPNNWQNYSPANCMARMGPNDRLTGGTADWRGMRWADGGITYTGFNTLTPPNSPACIWGGGDADGGSLSPSSMHPGGVHVVMGDASVRFITDAIDTGNLAATWQTFNGGVAAGPSPYGVWGALGSRNGGEGIKVP
jgi:hypothetical protein